MGTQGERETVGDDHRVPVRRYRAVQGDGRPSPALLWVHGGGFFRGSLDLPEADAVARTLAGHGVPVVTVGYRLAPAPGTGWLRRPGAGPSGRFPGALDDVLAAYDAVRAATPAGVVVGGASAGACLAAAAVRRAVGAGTTPLGTVLAYGFFHARHPRVTDPRQRSRRHRRLTHARWALDLANRNYAGSALALDDPSAFPGGHPVDGFPPALVLNAEHDGMRASGDRFAAELAEAGVAVDHHVLPGTHHAFLNRPGTPAFDEATGRIARWVAALGA